MELYIERERPVRNMQNGRFLPGFIPHNKGKRWDEWMSKPMREKRKKELAESLKKCDHSKCGGHNAKMIVGIQNGRFIGPFHGSMKAADYAGCFPEQIRNVCKGKGYTAGSIKWFYEEDFEKWIKEIKE